jgi:uncharacterized protein (DUF1786 family)
MGTQDVLLFDPGRRPENCIKMVFPSMTQILARRIREMEGDLFLTGETMGGGPIVGAIRSHIQKGFRVVMTPRAARTIRDDLKEVEGLGVEVVSEGEREKYSHFQALETRDFDLDALFEIFSALGEEKDIHWIGVAVQDHGHRPGKSDREFRFERFMEVVKEGARLHELGFVGEKEPPGYYTRMGSVLRSLREKWKGPTFLVDTKVAAIAGALHGAGEGPHLAVDVGNGHTMVAAVEGGTIQALLEHHTGILDREKLEDLCLRLAEGQVTHQEVFREGGHGCCIRRAVGKENLERIRVTGPKRDLFAGSRLEMEFASPFGDVMMTGPVGIVDMILKGGMNGRSRDPG